MKGFCHDCKVCNGKACGNTIPGPGAKGIGDVAIRNYKMWKEVRVVMDVLFQKKSVDTSCTHFGEKMELPIFAGPVGAVKMHYGDKYTDVEYNQLLIEACHKGGIGAFTGDGMDPAVVEAAAEAIGNTDSFVIPTIKPWDLDTIQEKFNLVKDAGVKVIAMDVDAAGLPFLKNLKKPAGSKSQEDLKGIIDIAERPFIVKGIMNSRAAISAIKAGASAIVISNHGGRVLDQCPSTAEVLKNIVDSIRTYEKNNDIESPCTILVDGGIRDGIDVFKAIAMGADGVLLARPFVNEIYEDGVEGCVAFINKLKEELRDTMEMCGAHKISQITDEMISIPKHWL